MTRLPKTVTKRNILDITIPLTVTKRNILEPHDIIQPVTKRNKKELKRTKQASMKKAHSHNQLTTNDLVFDIFRFLADPLKSVTKRTIKNQTRYPANLEILKIPVQTKTGTKQN